MWKSGLLTNRTRTQPGSLFHKAIKIRHLLVQRAEGHIFTLPGFSSEFFVIFRVLAKAIDTELRNLGWTLSLEFWIVEACYTIGT